MPETIIGSPIDFDAVVAEAATRAAAACVSASAQDLADVVDASALTCDWQASGIDSSAVDEAARVVYAGSAWDARQQFWSNDYTVEMPQPTFDWGFLAGQPVIMPYIEQMRVNDCCGFAGKFLRRDDEMPEIDISDDEFDRVLEECG